MKREGAFHTKAVHHHDLVLRVARTKVGRWTLSVGWVCTAPGQRQDGGRSHTAPHSLPRQRQEGGCSLLMVFPSLSPRQWKTMIAKPRKLGPSVLLFSRRLCSACSLLHGAIAPLCPTAPGSVQLLSAKLGSGSPLLLCHPWILPTPEPLFNTTPWSCVWRNGKGTGSDRGQCLQGWSRQPPWWREEGKMSHF